MIDRKRVHDLAMAEEPIDPTGGRGVGKVRGGTPAGAPSRQDAEGGVIAGEVAALIVGLEASPDGGEWLESLSGQFRHLLRRRLEQARLRLRTRRGKPLPPRRVEEIRSLIARFLAETRRLIDELYGPDIPNAVRGDLGDWFAWIGREFADHGLSDLWVSIRTDLPKGIDHV